MPGGSVHCVGVDFGQHIVNGLLWDCNTVKNRGFSHYLILYYFMQNVLHYILDP